MTRLLRYGPALALLAGALTAYAADPPASSKKIAIGTQAPAFKIKTQAGQVIDLAKLTEKGPVLVRLTCGCSGCDSELKYFQQIHDAYKAKGLTSLFVFKEPDAKVAKYAKDKKLNMLYAVDTRGDAWKAFQTTTMPTNFLIEKGGKIVAIAAGCEPSGLIAKALSEKVARAVRAKPVDVQKKVEEARQGKK